MSIIKQLFADVDMKDHKMEEIGKGSFGKIYKITTPDNAVYALKEIIIPRQKPESLSSVKYEVAIMRKISKITTIDGYLPFPKFFEYQENPFPHPGPNKYVYILMEYIDSFTLETLIQSVVYKTMDETLKVQLICHISIKILQAIDLLNQNGIIHKDLKNENIFINYKNGQVKLTSIHLIDFGLSCMRTDDVFDDPTIQYHHEKCPRTIAGSPYYIAPQLIDDVIRKQLTFKQLEAVDVWSFGVILFRMVYGQMPFTGKDIGDLFSNIVNYKTTNLSKILLNPNNVVEYSFSIIIGEILVVNNIRPTPQELITKFETILNTSK